MTLLAAVRASPVDLAPSQRKLTSGGIDEIAFAVGRVRLRTDKAVQLFEKVAVADEFVDFLTLAAYEELD